MIDNNKIIDFNRIILDKYNLELLSLAYLSNDYGINDMVVLHITPIVSVLKKYSVVLRDLVESHFKEEIEEKGIHFIFANENFIRFHSHLLNKI